LFIRYIIKKITSNTGDNVINSEIIVYL
jgi:hypothetical protein